MSLKFSSNIKKAPVLLIIYKKYQFLPEILLEIIQYAPPKLFIVQNKEENDDDLKLTQQVKNIIQEQNFDFIVEYLNHEVHLPISQSILKAINTVFVMEETLIILEDDVVPSSYFFTFCNQMLHKYRESNYVGCINGCNLNSSHSNLGYFYSNLSTPFWGWATWKSKWDINRIDNYYWLNFKEDILSSIEESNRLYFESVFTRNADNVNVWDLQWNLSLIANQLKTIVPTINLIKNKGFVTEGTSINYTNSAFSNLKIGELQEKMQMQTDIQLKSNYEKKIMELFQEITSNLKGNGRNRLLNRE